MWSDENGPYAGAHYQLAETICEPRPISRPYPPIIVRGGGLQKTLPLVARYADACNLFATSPARVSRKLEVLRQLCDREGRDYDAITKSILAEFDPTSGSADVFLSEMECYSRLGVTQVVVTRTCLTQRTT
jgi:alkanesulfonate monooxygenase SsuD/methylene tetrahydromethanopterin reductase-like flavin-dependent oxidoreductase (luciferase family)